MTRGRSDDDFRRAGARRPAPRRSLDPEAARLEAEQAREAEAEKKRSRKRLFNLLGNESLCLIIIFSLIGAWNWTAADFSGEYLTTEPKLGLVKLSLIRRAATVDGELYYNNTAAMEMHGGKGEMGKPLDFTFESEHNPNFHHTPLAVNRARFVGTIDGSTAEGMIIDRFGSHEVKLTKNLLASAFSQLQAHIPALPSLQGPTFFHASDHPRDVPQSPTMHNNN